NFVHNRGAFKDLPHPPPTDKPDWEKYVRYFHGQVRELCTKYGRIDGIWFDGSHKTVEEWRGKELYDMIKELQPNAVVNDRARWGDFFTPERSLPDDLTGYMFEACESISPTAWGYQDDMPAHGAASCAEPRPYGGGGRQLPAQCRTETGRHYRRGTGRGDA
ncbi:MAG TPA: alpha-L-fucosidase, partial [Candidatus Latescibacteria bacterium]|nr:alpha-L-fucosidase [Candidatus Latescibacterota bacterium]